MYTLRTLGLLFILAVVAAGCSLSPRVDHFHGTAYEFAKQSQLADPMAGRYLRPNTGMEGSVGAMVMDRYKAGYALPPARTERYSVTTEGITKQ